ncbi:two component transcriptional regulator, LuxR family [Amphibacillus marinus]|uniref:Two component transcriptional regulator, LuxR family n=1 Tax=Amphibacillus marinus TaxID=872970 RepID=A0A1H8K3D9_9BACI|nr:response regulator transcription factor [Amphibacillus marinus]SEN87569.1 two component transcriptional regulator, LuxR family [Amphibacillus marinus]
MVTILLAEDQVLVRQGLKMMIETDEELRVTGEAVNGEEAIQLCERFNYDLIILDIRMPIMSGLEAMRIIKKRWPNRKILILTTFNDEAYALEALKNGANGYMLKDANADELIRAIRSCLKGGLTIEDQVAAKVMPALIRDQELIEIHPDLTKRELDIIIGIGEGLTNKEIADQLFLSIGTVKNHISVILDKLELRDRTQIAIYALRHKIVQ